VEKKGLEMLLKAGALLSAGGVDFTMDLIGGGEVEGGSDARPR